MRLLRLPDVGQALVATTRREIEHHSARRKLKAALLRAQHAELRADIAEREVQKLTEIIKHFCETVDELTWAVR